MRRLNQFIAFMAVAVLLSACSGFKTHTEVEALKEAKAVGSPFTQRLTAEYKELVKDKQKWMDYADAKHFAKKGLMSAEGKVVMPEPISNWHLNDTSTKAIRPARIRLLQALNAGGRAQVPFESALAQAKFDCWIEQEESNWASNKSPLCRTQFESAMNDLESRMAKILPPSEKAGMPVPVAPKPEPVPEAVDASMDEGMFLVFFDFDKSVLNEGGFQVVEQVAEQAKKRDDLKSLVIVGHADTSGSDAYNQRLSQRRADAVKKALADKGVTVDIRTEARGEKELMVQTPNNTREPANRRAEIKFE